MALKKVVIYIMFLNNGSPWSNFFGYVSGSSSKKAVWNSPP